MALVIVGGVSAAWVLMRQAGEAQKQVAALLAENDSLSRSFATRLAQTGIAEEALAAQRAESERLASELRARQESGGDVRALSAAMRTAQQRTAILNGTDYPAIAAANKPAIVFIAVEMPDGAPSSGTGFNILPGTHPIVPVMLGDAALAARVAEAMLQKGVYVIGFSYPVVPQGKARIRTQISAAHTREDLTLAIGRFAEVKRELAL